MRDLNVERWKKARAEGNIVHGTYRFNDCFCVVGALIFNEETGLFETARMPNWLRECAAEAFDNLPSGKDLEFADKFAEYAKACSENGANEKLMLDKFRSVHLLPRALENAESGGKVREEIITELKRIKPNGDCNPYFLSMCDFDAFNTSEDEAILAIRRANGDLRNTMTPELIASGVLDVLKWGAETKWVKGAIQ